jgi:peroxiredoxin
MQIDRRGLILAGGSACLAGSTPGPKIGQPSPPFDVFTFDWKKIHYQELGGQVVLLNFWASWCTPCLNELPRLDAYFRKHTGAPLRIFAVRSDDAKPNQAFIKLSKVLAFPLVWHLDGGAGFGPIGGAVPSNFVIDSAGILRYAAAGAFEEGSLEQVITPLLDAAARARVAST